MGYFFRKARAQNYRFHLRGSQDRSALLAFISVWHESRRRDTHFGIVAWTTTRPLRVIASIVLVSTLMSFISASSMTVALAGRHNPWMGWLWFSDPYTLLAMAKKKLAELEELAPVADAGPFAHGYEQDARPAHHASALQSQLAARLKLEIAQLALKAWLRAPLDPEALRLMGAVAPSRDMAREYMRGAVALSSRNRAALVWLLNDAFANGDYSTLVQAADLILSSQLNLQASVLPQLATLATVPEARKQLATALGRNPKWRDAFVRQLARVNTSRHSSLELFLIMKQNGIHLSDRELAVYLNEALNYGASPMHVYNLWLQLLPDHVVPSVMSYRNLNFATEPSGIPFDWRMPRLGNVKFDFRSKPNTDSRILALNFGTGRVDFGDVNQVILLQPGDYEFQGRFGGQFKSRRGMRWSVSCIPSSITLVHSEPMRGMQGLWGSFRVSFRVPDSPSCEAQLLKLYHDTRSPSEQYATGEFLVSGLTLRAR